MESKPRPAQELWRRTLANIPSIYARLAFLASLRDVNTGRYEHHGLAMIFGPEEAAETIRRSHEDTFLEWLALRLEQQKADLELYFSTLPAGRQTLVENWLRLAPYRSVIPAWASPAQRELYEANFAVLLEMLRGEPGSSPEL